MTTMERKDEREPNGTDKKSFSFVTARKRKNRERAVVVV